MSTNNRLIDLIITNSNTDDYLISNGKIKKFCPFGFFNKSNDKIKDINSMEDINDGRKQ